MSQRTHVKLKNLEALTNHSNYLTELRLSESMASVCLSGSLMENKAASVS